MRNLSNLKTSLCQMPVIPGRPDLNAQYVIERIEEAAENDVDIIVFPEMCISGYLIGDLFEDDYFVKDVGRFNNQIVRAVPAGMTVIFGTLLFDWEEKNEDGRLRKYNAAVVASGGKTLAVISKTLQPNYTIFDDDRHFFSTRKQKESDDCFLGIANQKRPELADYLEPVEIETRIGKVMIGVTICEDMWKEFYHVNPTEVLAAKGADIVFNISMSPWTWRKNRKRHQIVRDLLKHAPVPFVYVNGTGRQNNGKNLIVFDGSSTIYDNHGEIIFAVDPYSEGSHEFIFPPLGSQSRLQINPNSEPEFMSLAEQNRYEADELYAGWHYAVLGAIENLPKPMRKVIIGLSGGIDSAVVATLVAEIIGPENVYAINMPSHYNSEKTKNIAEQIAKNLGIHYLICPINDVTQAIRVQTGVEEDCLTDENIQARSRMELLAAYSQKIGGVFTCNSNKIEMAFGYGTMYGDMAGFLAPLGDMLKYEVYQMADYLNRVVYKREVIPAECFKLAPSAELKNEQKDPYHYGSLEHRGYHDELVRSFVEFRKNPEWILEKYAKDSLEAELRLEPGILAQLFKTPAEFIIDLEKNYRRFIVSFFKRHPAPQIPILSRRSFGFNLRESMLSPYFTTRYYDLKKSLLSRDNAFPRIAIFGGSFNPACKHHQEIALALASDFNKVIVIPCGDSRTDKESVREISNEDRGVIATLAFEGMENVELDLSDLDNDVFTPTYQLQERYAAKYPNAEIWHVVGADIIIGGRDSNSQIQRGWQNGKDIWENLNFCVIVRPGYEIVAEDLPPVSRIKEISEIHGSGTMIRKMLRQHKNVSEFVADNVLEFILGHHLYGS